MSNAFICHLQKLSSTYLMNIYFAVLVLLFCPEVSGQLVMVFALAYNDGILFLSKYYHAVFCFF